MGLCNHVGNVVENVVNVGKEGFNSHSCPVSAGTLVASVLYVVLVLVAGRYLWDNVLCKVVTFCKPLPSLLHLLGLILLLDLLRP